MPTKTITTFYFQVDIIFVGNGFTKVNLFVHKVEAIVVGCHLVFHTPHVPICRQRIVDFALIHLQTYLSRLTFNSTKDSIKCPLGTPNNVDGFNIRKKLVTFTKCRPIAMYFSLPQTSFMMKLKRSQDKGLLCLKPFTISICAEMFRHICWCWSMLFCSLISFIGMLSSDIWTNTRFLIVDKIVVTWLS